MIRSRLLIANIPSDHGGLIQVEVLKLMKTDPALLSLRDKVQGICRTGGGVLEDAQGSHHFRGSCTVPVRPGHRDDCQDHLESCNLDEITTPDEVIEAIFSPIEADIPAD